MSSSNVPVRKECNLPGKACYSVWRSNFEIDDTYQPTKAIGKGAYGVVVSAKHLPTGEKVAIKKITNAFDNLTDARRTLREMRLLRHLRSVFVQCSSGFFECLFPWDACFPATGFLPSPCQRPQARKHHHNQGYHEACVER
jgi:serine/threonine protein kinase